MTRFTTTKRINYNLTAALMFARLCREVSQNLHRDVTGIKGGMAFFSGMALASGGAFNNLMKGVKLTFTAKFKLSVVRTMASFFFQFPWRVGLR